MKNPPLSKIFAANVTYNSFTYNTKMLIEYEHTGTQYYCKTNKGTTILSGIDSAIEKVKKGKKVSYSAGYYFIKRMAIQTIASELKIHWWYINEPDYIKINKSSKYWNKIHKQLSEEVIKPFTVTSQLTHH